MKIKTMLAVLLIAVLLLYPVAMMEETLESQTMIFEEASPITVEPEVDDAKSDTEESDPVDDSAEADEDDTIESEQHIVSEPVDDIVEEIEAVELTDLPILEAQSEVDELDLEDLNPLLEGSVYSGEEEEGDIPIDKDHFPDDEFRKWVLGFDKDGDESLSVEERSVGISATFGVYTHSSNENGQWETTVIRRVVNDFTGIEYFPYLYDLTINSGEVPILNLSKNTELRSLFCTNIKLTSLDVSGCEKLRHLRCGNNQLSSLDVGKNMNLLYLECNDNDISGLDVQNIKHLISLDCSNNNISVLDVSKTTFTSLNCSYNQLTSLDVSNSSLESLNCEGNQIESLTIGTQTSSFNLDCSNNQLTSVDLDGCVDTLFIFDCRENRLSSLDLSGFHNLDTLYCGNNSMQSLNIAGCEKLSDLSCDQNQLTQLDVKDCVHLLELDCRQNPLLFLDLDKNGAMKELLCHSTKLTTLDIRKCPKLVKCVKNAIKESSESGDVWIYEYEDDTDEWYSLYVDKKVGLVYDDEAKHSSESPASAPTPTFERPTITTPQEIINIAKVPSSVKAKAKKNKVTVTWKKIKKTRKTKTLLNQIKSIEVQYSTDPTFVTNVQTKNLGKKKTKVILKGLQKKTVYYIRVRYTDGAGGVSNWSATKKVKTKK